MIPLTSTPFAKQQPLLINTHSFDDPVQIVLIIRGELHWERRAVLARRLFGAGATPAPGF